MKVTVWTPTPAGAGTTTDPYPPALVLAAPWLKSFLHFTSAAPFIILAFAVLLGVPLTFSNAYLQGMKRFGALAWSNIVAAATKLAAT